MADTGYDPVERRARFAVNFQNTTDLDQRRRFAQDISEAKVRDDERKAAEYESMLQRNPNLMNAVTARTREDRMAREGFQRSELANRRLEFDMGKEERANTLAQQRILFDQSREERALRKEQLDLETANRMEQDTLSVQEEELKLRQSALPGSSAYQRGVIDIFLRHPHVDKSFRAEALKGAGFQDPDEAWKSAADAVSNGAQRATVKLPGGGTATLTSPKPETLKVDVNRLDKLTKERSELLQAKPGERNEERIGYLDNEIAAIDKVRQQIAGQSTQSPQADLTDPEQFKKAFQEAAPGTILTYGGRQWRKP